MLSQQADFRIAGRYGKTGIDALHLRAVSTIVGARETKRALDFTSLIGVYFKQGKQGSNEYLRRLP
jgi:hypothetical protein